MISITDDDQIIYIYNIFITDGSVDNQKTIHETREYSLAIFW